MNDILTGCLLGNGHLRKNGIFYIRLKESRLTYLKHLNKLLPSTKISEVIDKKYGKKYFYFYSTEKFKEMYNLWYVNKQKVIPNNLKLTKESLAHWYAQDGFDSKKNYSLIYTSNFKKTEVEFLKNALLKDLDINLTIVKSKNNYWLRAGSGVPICEFIKPYLKGCELFENKLKRKRLSLEQQKQIRGFYEHLNKTQMELAEEFGVSQAYINKIINKFCKDDNFKFKGEAIVKLDNI